MVNEEILDPTKRYGVVAHDAGAANILISWLEASSNPDFEIYFEGPASKLLPDALVEEQCDSLEILLSRVSIVLTGTGWASTLEYDAIEACRLRGIEVVSLVDHWTNYEERFIRYGRKVLPNEIWVTDEYAFNQARKIFPSTQLYIKPNLYMQRQVAQSSAFVEKVPFQLLYVGGGGMDPSEELASLEFLLHSMKILKIPRSTEITIRPHPSDNPLIYIDWIKESNEQWRTKIDDVTSLSEAIGRSHWIVGRETLPLVIAALAGKVALCALTPKMGALRLPHGEIVQIRDVLRNGIAV